MKKILLAFLFLFCLQNIEAQSVKDSLTQYFYSNGNVSSAGFMRDGKPDGYWKTYYENGILKTEGNRKNFELDSLWKFYDSKGKLYLSISYKKGIKDGPRTQYFKNKVVVENFKNNKKNGLTLTYYPSGKLWKKLNFKDGLEDGYEVMYAEEDGRIIGLTRFQKGFLKQRSYINRKNEDGQKIGVWKSYWPGDEYIVKSEESYRDGIKDGYFKYYDKEGNLEHIDKYIYGVLMPDPPELAQYDIKKDYFSDGKVKTIGSYKDGVAEGMRREYDHEGKIVAAYLMHKGRIIGKGIIDKQGNKQGPWEEYYLSGKLQAKGSYKDDIKIGSWKYYFENSQLEQEGFYDLKGREKGKWTWYYPNGNIRRKESFFEGVQEAEIIEYATDSTILVQGQYVDGSKEGFWTEQVNGYKDEGEYLEDMQQGLWKSYYPNGKLYHEGKYLDDFPDGEHKWYYNSGVLKKTGSYSMGLRHGEWRYFDESGKIYLRVEYKNGIEIRYDSKTIEPELSPDEMTE